MAVIKIRDYEIESSMWGGTNVIGMGNNHSGVIVPIIDKAIEDKEPEITVHLNSVGGSVWCSLAITNALKRAKEGGAKIITINEGVCLSATTQIFMEGDERIVYNSLFMIHKPAGFYCGLMTEDDMRREAEALKVCQDTILLTYAPSGLDDNTLNDLVNAETWMTPALCLSLGFATEDRSAPDKKVDVLESAMNMINKTAPANKVYANKFFNTITLKNSKMDVQETLKQNTETMKKSNSLLNQLKDFFTNLGAAKNEGDEPEATNASSDLEDGGKIYYLGVLGVGTEVFSDEALTQHIAAGSHDLADGNYIVVDDAGLVTEMEKNEEAPEEDTANSADVDALKAENQSLQTALNATNEKLAEVNSLLAKLKNTKSNYTPASREQEIIDKASKTPSNDGRVDLSPEARKARKEEREQIKNSKNKK